MPSSPLEPKFKHVLVTVAVLVSALLSTWLIVGIIPDGRITIIAFAMMLLFGIWRVRQYKRNLWDYHGPSPLIENSLPVLKVSDEGIHLLLDTNLNTWHGSWKTGVRSKIIR